MDTSQLSLLTSAAASGLALTLAAPFERLKLILQTQPIAKVAHEQRLLSLSSALPSLLRHQGLLSLWKGNALLIQKNLTQLFLCDYVLRHLHPHRDGQPLPLSILGALLSSAAASIFVHPLDLIRVRVSVDNADLSHDRIYRGFYDGFRKIMTNEGPKALYKGYTLHLLSTIPFFSLALSSQHFATQHYSHPTFISLGALCSMAARCLVYPLEVVTHRLQVNGSPDYLHRYKGIKDAFSTIYRLEGLAGFYRGLGVSIIPLGVHAFVYCNLYEVMMDLQLQQLE